jgi:hypothetical protein
MEIFKEHDTEKHGVKKRLQDENTQKMAKKKPPRREALV